MALLSYYDALLAVSQLSISGVERTYALANGGPASLADADLPAQWVMLPGAGESALANEPVMVGASQGLHTLRATLVVAVAPVAKGDRGAKFVESLQMLDAACTAVAGLSGGAGPVSYTGTVTTQLVVAGIEYWGVLVTIEIPTIA